MTYAFVPSLCTGEGLHLEVKGAKCVGQLCVLGSSRVAVAKEDVVQPLRQHCLPIHEVSDALQHCFEVILLQHSRQAQAPTWPAVRRGEAAMCTLVSSTPVRLLQSK